MNEKIPKAVVLEYPDGSKPKKSKSLFKSKTHLFAALGVIVTWFPSIEKLMSENTEATMLIIYIGATILRRCTSGKVHLYKEENEAN